MSALLHSSDAEPDLLGCEAGDQSGAGQEAIAGAAKGGMDGAAAMGARPGEEARGPAGGEVEEGAGESLNTEAQRRRGKSWWEGSGVLNHGWTRISTDGSGWVGIELTT
jgi:hypothetical protein